MIGRVIATIALGLVDAAVITGPVQSPHVQFSGVLAIIAGVLVGNAAVVYAVWLDEGL